MGMGSPSEIGGNNDPLYLQLNPNQETNRTLRRLWAALLAPEPAEPLRDAILFQGEPGPGLMEGRYNGHAERADRQSSALRPLGFGYRHRNCCLMHIQSHVFARLFHDLPPGLRLCAGG